MARLKKSAGPRPVKKIATAKTWSSLTWADLDRWAGSRSASRGQTYQRQGRVKELAIAEDGRLLATVVGSERYVTSAWLESGKRKSQTVESVCSCPVGASGCKHAIAIVAEYLAALAEQREVPVAEPDDRRWARLSEEVEEEFDGADDDFAGDDFEDDDFGEADTDDDSDERDDEADLAPIARKPTPRKRSKNPQRQTHADWDQKIKSHVEQKSRAELAELVWSLMERFPELRQEFQERILLSEGKVDQLVAAARRELRAVTRAFGWRNHWQGEDPTPNYSRLKHRLERLAELGQGDEVVALGRELIARGIEQVGQCDDEGETAMELSESLSVVFAALAKSSLSAVDQILYVIDACLQDDYDVIDEDAGKILAAKWSAADWSAVADQLAKRLQKSPQGKDQDDFSRNYRRDCISQYLSDALERAGRQSELLPLYEAEARASGSYRRLVQYLIAQGRYEEAEQWAREGIEKTQKKYPGSASELVKTLCELASRRKQWDVVAAHLANDFFLDPSSRGFKELEAAAKKAKCQKPVCAAALKFLESGVAPIRAAAGKDGSCQATTDPAWPLPVPDYLIPLMSVRAARSAPRPYFNVLIDMAIAAKRPADVWQWYETMTVHEKHANRGPHYYVQQVDSERVAKAVAGAYPERALAIYRTSWIRS